jgi:hypothetical protein
VPELVRHDSEPLVHKSYGDSFEGTELEAVLADRGVGRLIVTGAQTDACIRSTLHGALVRGYDVTSVGDAHTTENLSEYGAPPPEQVIAHTNLYGSGRAHPGPALELSIRRRSASQRATGAEPSQVRARSAATCRVLPVSIDR